MKKKKHILRKLLSIFVALTITVSSVPLSFATEVSVQSALRAVEAPKNTMRVDRNIITASAHAEAALLPEVLGCNVTSGYSIVGNSAPRNLEAACNEPMMAVWGTDYNESPDPYIWNYFYNYRAVENGLELSDKAVINPNYSVYKNSASEADDNLLDIYGDISASLSTRPDILIGCSEKGMVDFNGYNDQISRIRKFEKDGDFYCNGDENYAPYLVSYNGDTLDSAIKSMYEAAAAINKIVGETGKRTRYGNPEDIANLYEAYIYGLQYYIKYKQDDGWFEDRYAAVVIDYNDDGTFKLATKPTECKIVDYIDKITKNIALRENVNKNAVTLRELASADVIILSGIKDENKEQRAKYDLHNSGYLISPAGIIICGDGGDPMSSINNGSIEDALEMMRYSTLVYYYAFEEEFAQWLLWFYKNIYHIDSKQLEYYAKHNTYLNQENDIVMDSINSYYDSIISGYIKKGLEHYNRYYSKYNNNKKIYVPALGMYPPTGGGGNESINTNKFAESSKKQQSSQKESFACRTFTRFFADPVDTLTGAHQIDQSYLPQTGATDFGYDIHYDSSRLSKGRLGTGWYDSYEKKIEEKSDGTLLYYSSPTSYLEFEPESSAASTYSCSAPGRTSWSITKGTDGGYTVTKSNDGQDIFDKNGRLIRIKDHTGKSLELTYTSSSIKITEPVSGRTLTLTLDSTGKVIGAADTAGGEVTLTYDSADMLTSITDPAGEVQSFTYDEYGHVLSGKNTYGTYFTDTYNEKGLVSTQLDAEGSVSNFIYEDTDDGKITTCIDRNGNTSVIKYDKNGFLISSTDRNGNTTSYTYDENGNILTEKSPDGSVITNTYNSDDKLTSKKTAEGRLTSYTYDTSGNMLTVTDAKGHTVTNTFDASNRLTSTTDITGKKNIYEYDENGLLIKKTVGDHIWEYTYINGKPETEKDPEGNVTRYKYDAAGRVTEKTDAEGNSVKYSYDKAGRQISETDGNGNKQYVSYNCFNDPQKVTDSNGNVTEYTYDGNAWLRSEKHSDGGVISYTYDKEGRLTKTTDALANITTNTYDAEGRLLTVTDAAGGKTSYTYDKAGNVLTETDPLEAVKKYTYDKDGNRTSYTDANGNKTTYVYDSLSRLISETDAAGHMTTYAYDITGNVNKTTDAAGNTSKSTYDKYGNMLTSTDANGNMTTYTYDKNGNMLSKTDAEGNVISYTYYANGNTKTITNSISQADKKEETDSGASSIKYEYDSDSNVTAYTDQLGNVTTYGYDPNGNMTDKTDPEGRTTSYTYDSMNRMISVTDGNGDTTTYEHDNNGNRITATTPEGRRTSYSYDALNRLIKTKDATGGISEKSYDAVGNLLTIKDPLGGKTVYTYDPAGNMLTESTSSNGTVTYTYDSLNRIEKRTDARGNEIAYTYDDLGRLTEKTGLETDSAKYTYDAVGNMLTAENYAGKTIKTYNSLNMLTELKTTNGKTFRYNYDARGNMTEMIYPGEKSVTYSYDAANRLTSVTDWNGNETIYEYGGSGELVSIMYPDGSIEFREYDGAGQLTLSERHEGDTTDIIERARYGYDRDGLMLREETDENSAAPAKISEMQYDSLGRLGSKASRMNSSSDEKVSVESYKTDAAGNILTREVIENGNISADLLKDMEYDEQNKLIRIDDKKLWYDEDGNMLGIDDVSTQKASDTDNISTDKTSQTAVTGSTVKNSGPSWTGVSANKAAYRNKVPKKKETMTEAAVTGTTDAESEGSDDEEASGDDSEDHQNGEQQTRAIRDDGTYEEYYYDSSRHLLSAEATDYGYDAEENRYGTYDRTTGKESLYTYADTPYGTQLVISETSTGEEQTYVYGNGLISSTDGYGRTAVYHYDYRGSTTSLTDTEGNILAAYSYGTYGDCTKEAVTDVSEIFSQDEEVDTIFRYNGRDGVVTDGNGMYYMRSRYYSPYLMRFINADVYTGSIENSPTLNRYAYANGNPISNIDPYGTSAQYAKVSSVGHTILDVGSYVPVVGNACDLVNGIWYATEGDYVNAALSAYSAIPGAGAAGNVVKATRDTISVAGVGFVYDVSKGIGNTKKATKLADKAISEVQRVTFPRNPEEFNPNGLTKIGPFESGNGKIIKWVDENKKAVFEWDEDLKYGSHYHVIGSDGKSRLADKNGETHFLPGGIFEK